MMTASIGRFKRLLEHLTDRKDFKNDDVITFMVESRTNFCGSFFCGK